VIEQKGVWGSNLLPFWKKRMHLRVFDDIKLILIEFTDVYKFFLKMSRTCARFCSWLTLKVCRGAKKVGHHWFKSMIVITSRINFFSTIYSLIATHKLSKNAQYLIITVIKMRQPPRPFLSFPLPTWIIIIISFLYTRIMYVTCIYV
jgi:hypothetical protein